MTLRLNVGVVADEAKNNIALSWLFLFGEIPNWTMTLMLNEFSVLLNLKILYQGKVKQSPAKILTKTQVSLVYLDKTFNRYM